MSLVGIKINKIVIHQIYQRDSEGNKKDPFKGNGFIKFDESALNNFNTRVVNALGEGSKAVKMEIVEQNVGYVPKLIDALLLNKSDKQYIDISYQIAQKLADAQNKRSIPGGVIVIFSGVYSVNQREFVGIIKADIYSAYEKILNEDNGEISLKYIEEILLTPSTKLYKTAGFFKKKGNKDSSDLNEHWDVMVSDYQIGKSDGKAAAMYFYSLFLGCGYPKTSARTTKQFYETVRTFLNELDDIPEEKRNDLHNALNTYLKHETKGTIDPSEFAERYFVTEQKDLFINYLEDNELPTTAFTKDLEYISNKLKTRKIGFSKNIKISAPSQVFTDYIIVEEENSEQTKGETWTKLTIKDRIIFQE